MTATPTTTIFVYGSLKRGESNHRLLARARFLGRAHTAPFFELYDLGAFPAMVAGGFTSVAGELYEVDEETLAAIDRLEGHPTLYRRTPTPLAEGGVADAYMLARPWKDAQHLTSGSWRGQAL
jgi:gamma-glutamylcyclotransferase (GGCT)/AIG2-like uncharacterized protein YtfP